MQYIPQAPPFVMIDDLLHADDAGAETSFHIKSGHLFVENDVFTESGLIENMAQTAAAGTGKQSADNGEAPPVGFIGAIKGLQVYSLPKVGSTINTQVNYVTRIMNASIVTAMVMCDGNKLAEAEFKIFLQ